MNSTVSKAQKDMESAEQKALLTSMLATGVQRRTAIRKNHAAYMTRFSEIQKTPDLRRQRQALPF